MRRPRLLDPRAIETALERLPGWTCDGAALRRVFEFPDFAAAFSFMTRVAELAEAADHHPDWSNSYGKVDVRLTTHDAGGLTRADVSLAHAIDAAAE